MTVEFSKENDGKKEMAISADGLSELFPHVIRIFNEPKLLTKWIVTPFRQRIKNIDAVELKMNDMSINASEILFVYCEANNKMDLVIYIKDINAIDNSIVNIVFLLLDSTIGEYDVVSKIGKIDVKPFNLLKSNDRAYKLNELPMLVDSMK